MTTILGRRVILTTLDDIPPRFRCVSGALALNATELAAFQRGAKEDIAILQPIVDRVQAADMAEALLPPEKIKRRRTKLSPSNRLFLLSAINPGRRAA